MKKLISCITVLTAILLVFAGCSNGSTTPAGGGKTDPKIRSIALNLANASGVQATQRPDVLPVGATVNLSAAIDGTDGTNGGEQYSRKYTISLTKGSSSAVLLTGATKGDHDPALANVNLIDETNGGKLLVVTGQAGDQITVSVAVSPANASVEPDTWSFVIGNSSVTVGNDVDLNDPDLKPEGTVTGISLRYNGSVTIPTTLAQGATGTVSAVVTGNGEGIDKTYSLILDDASGEVTLVDGTLTINADATVGGTFKITATTNETVKTLLGTAMKDEVTITITSGSSGPGGPIDPPDFTGAQWVVWNTNPTPEAGTTTVMPTAVNNRYTLKNVETNANIDGVNFAGATFVYLNVPLQGGPEANWTKYGFEARVRLTGAGPGTLNVGKSVIAGIFRKPDEAVAAYQAAVEAGYTASTDPHLGRFVPSAIGQRRSSQGQYRIFSSRSNGYGGYEWPAATSPIVPGTTGNYRTQFSILDWLPAGFGGQSNWATKTKMEAFADQEYVYRIDRTEMTTYVAQMLSADKTTDIGGTAFASGGWTTTAGNEPSGYHVDADNPVYVGFILSGVEAEVSNITVYWNDEVLWEDAAVKGSALDYGPNRVYITASNAGEGTAPAGYDYLTYAATFSGVSLSGVITPASLGLDPEADITWSIKAGSKDLVTLASFQGNAVLSKNAVATDAFGDVTIVATPQYKGSPYPSGAAEFKILFEEPADATGVTVKTLSGFDSGVIVAGDGTTGSGLSVDLVATVAPPKAPQNVTWTIGDTNTGTGGSTYATIATNGTIATVTANDDVLVSQQTVYVVATASTGTNIASTAFEITVLPNWTPTATTTFTFADSAGNGAVADATAIAAFAAAGWTSTSADTTYATPAVLVKDSITLSIFAQTTAGVLANVRWNGTQGGPTGYRGCIQTTNPGPTNSLFTITGLNGPFRITVVYAGAGNTPTTPADRRAEIRLGDYKVTSPGVDPGASSTSTRVDATLMELNSAATNQTAYVDAVGGFRIYAVIIEH